MISILVTARASWAKLSPVVRELVKLQANIEIVACASAVLEKFGRVSRFSRQEFPQIPLTELYTVMEGTRPVTIAKDSGILLQSLADHYAQVNPALVLICADRYETHAAIMAACYQGIPVAHLQGGERTGTLDDVVRNANTVLSTWHFPATSLSALRVNALTGGAWDHIFMHGCPSIDVALESLAEPPVGSAELSGSGADISPHYRFAFVLQHPDICEWTDAFEQMTTTLKACRNARIPIILQWPNTDTGSDLTSKAIRVFRDRHPEVSLKTIPNFPPHRFLRLLSQASVLVGNSSAFIREASYLGVPAVNIGDRQHGREYAANVTHCGYDCTQIENAIVAQLTQKHYPRSLLYGDGHAGPRIAQQLVKLALAQEP